MEVLPCLILPMIKFFVIGDTNFLLKYGLTALMLGVIVTKEIFS